MHTFINVFEFAGDMYLAEARVRAEEEDIRLSVDPNPHPDLEDAVELFLDEWLDEVIDCHIELRKTVA
jgi:hypothetical protein